MQFPATSRRTFLATGAMAIASAALVRRSGFAAEAAPSFVGKIKKAVKYHMVIGEMSIAEKFQLVKDLGYDGIEVRRVDMKGEDPAPFREASDKTGLPIHGLINSSNPDLAGAVRLSQAMGGSSVLYVAGRVNEKTPYDENYRVTQEVLRTGAPHAEKAGIRILVENVWNEFLLSPLEMARYLDEIKSPAVGAYFDVGNVVRFGWPEQWIRILGARIGKLDIKEYSRDKQINEGLRKGFEVEIGEGSVDWAAVRAALADIGYQGWATAEVKGGGRERLADIAARMDRVLALK